MDMMNRVAPMGGGIGAGPLVDNMRALPVAPGTMPMASPPPVEASQTLAPAPAVSDNPVAYGGAANPAFYGR